MISLLRPQKYGSTRKGRNMRADLKGYSKHKTFCFSFFTSVLSVPSVVEKEYNDHGNTDKHGKEEV